MRVGMSKSSLCTGILSALALAVSQDVVRSAISLPCEPLAPSKTLRLPGQYVTFNMLRESNFFHQEHYLSAMMHTVREEVRQCAAKRLETRRVVERIHKAVIISLLAGNSSSHVCEIPANETQPLN